MSVSIDDTKVSTSVLGVGGAGGVDPVAEPDAPLVGHRLGSGHDRFGGSASVRPVTRIASVVTVTARSSG